MSLFLLNKLLVSPVYKFTSYIREKAHIVIGWGISVLILFWLYGTVDWQAVWIELQSLNYFYLIPLTLILAIHFALRAVRWRYLLPQIDHSHLRLMTLHQALMLGNFGSIALPFRAGEFIRPYVLSLQSKHSFLTAFVSVVVERIFDLAIVLLLFGVMILAIPGIPEIAHAGAATLLWLAVVMIMITTAATIWPVFVSKIAVIFFNYLPATVHPKLNDILEKLLRGVTPLKSLPNLTRVIMISILVWASSFFYYQVGLWMLDIHGSGWISIAVGVMIALAVAAPSAPGFIGVFQAGTIAGFALFGVSKESATAYSIVMHLHQLLYISIWGILLLINGKLGLNSLRPAVIKPS